jgi:tetratricopeptide (TPR) repeat protein
MTLVQDNPDPDELLNIGYRARREGRLADAKAAYTRAEELCRESGNAWLLARALARVGGIERDLGETSRALAAYREAVAVLRGLSSGEQNPLMLAHTVRHVGDILHEGGQSAEALRCYQEALSIYRGNPETESLDLANALRGYALTLAELGERDAAREAWREAGKLYDSVWREPGSPYSQADLAPGVAESERQIALLS